MIHSAIKQGYRPCLFLDEIDKISPSEFKMNRLMQLVDAVYEAEGQLVATSNKTLTELISKWGENEAGTVLRRIGAGDGAKAIHFIDSPS
jgi:predicted ATPase